MRKVAPLLPVPMLTGAFAFGQAPITTGVIQNSNDNIACSAFIAKARINIQMLLIGRGSAVAATSAVIKTNDLFFQTIHP